MSFIADRVYQKAVSPGSGVVTPSTAVAGYQTFSAGIPSGSVIPIAIESQVPGDWELCDATWNGTTLTRGTISGSSTGGSRVTFTGPVNVFLTPSSRYLSAAPTTIAYDTGTISPVSGQKVVYRVTMTGNLIINEPSSKNDGDQVEFWLIASGAPRTVTFSSTWAHIPSSSTLTSPVTIASGTQGELMFRYDSTLGAWKAARFVNGYS